MGLIAPTLPSAGGLRGTEELVEITALNTILTLLNGNVNGENLAAAAFASYKTVFRATASLAAAESGSRLVLANGQNTPSASTLALPPALFQITADSWPLTGKTPKLRLVTEIDCNGVSPGTGLVVVEVAMYRVTAIAGTAGSVTLTLAGSKTLSTAPFLVASERLVDTSVDIDVPTASPYVFLLTPSTALAAGAMANVNLRVELHHV